MSCFALILGVYAFVVYVIWLGLCCLVMCVFWLCGSESVFALVLIGV